MTKRSSLLQDERFVLYMVIGISLAKSHSLFKPLRGPVEGPGKESFGPARR